MAMILEITEGPGAGRSFTFAGHNVVLVGRSGRCHCQVGPDRQCSRVHLVVEASPPNCWLRDLGTTNGTYVNGQRVTEAQLKDGDSFRIGQTTVRVTLQAARELPEGSAPPGAPVVQPPAPPPPPAPDGTIHGYRLIRQLGQGGMGVVWLAEPHTGGRQVVVKTMQPQLYTSENAQRMFDREVEISRSLHHPHIAEVIDAGRDDGIWYIVVEYVPGRDAEVLRREAGGRVPAADVVTLGRQSLEALEYAHAQSVVHRDMKPSNILVNGSSPGFVAKVTDFGLARICGAAGESGITQQGDVRGTLPYMPPEQVLNCRGVDHRADIFGLGATLYHLLTGHYVYEFRPADKDPLLTIIEDDVIPIEARGVSLPGGLCDIINRSLCKEPAGRYASALEMNEALAREGA
jgi:eukaryotic-like serine/threonine-protein kinase